jgi:hypothetical protein
LLFANASHLGAEMHGLEVHRHAVGVEEFNERVSDLLADALLKREASSEESN